MMRRTQGILAILAIAACFAGGVTFPAWAQNFADLSNEGAGGALVEEQDQIDKRLNEVVDATGVPELTPEEASQYTLGITDEITVTVMRHPEVSGEYVINNEGKIQYEFAGDIKVAGLNKEEATQAIRERLKEYIIDPDVSVKISGYNSKIVYVVGEVGLPGKIFMQGDTITIREALMRAGLPQLSGVTKRSWLITPSTDGKPIKKRVNVYALLYEGDLRENFIMKPGDVIYIPATFLTKAMRAIQPITAPVSDAAGAGRTVYPY